MSSFVADKKVRAKKTDFTNISKPKPFVKWVGGKRQLLSQYKKLGILPPPAFSPQDNTYHEPFVGGGALFFELRPARALLSDLNWELVVTYNIIKSGVEDLIKELKRNKYRYEKNNFLAIRALQPEQLSAVEIAARFIYLNRTAFNGMYRVNRSGRFNVPFGRYDSPLICDADNLRQVSLALLHTEVLHQDYKRVLDVAKPHDFVYFDPPYYPLSKTASFTAYTAEAFLEKEQEELRDTMLELHNRGCQVMLSNSDTPLINNLYSNINGVKIHKVVAGRAINSKATGRGKLCEVLVINY